MLKKTPRRAAAPADTDAISATEYRAFLVNNDKWFINNRFIIELAKMAKVPNSKASKFKISEVLSINNRAAAEDSYRHALSVAQGQDAKLWELRAARDLARLWRDQGKRPQAGDLLASVHGWFTEGFDTLDLKQSKALLEELAS
jgi:hypothetical protein